MTAYPQVKSDPYAWPFDGRFSPSDTALIVIDMQRDFCDADGWVGQHGADVSPMRAVIDPIKTVLERLRSLGFPIIHTREGHRPDLADLNDNKRWRSAREGAEIGSAGPCGRMLTRGEPCWEIVPELAPAPGEPIIDKPGKGAFYATDLEQILRARGIRNLIFTGVTTDCCVHTTMRDANDRGFECMLLDDCCAASLTHNHAAILTFTKMGDGLFGTVGTSAQLFEALS
ncbi:peroxyureidoacrylate/ureidoacrylate amidohydrolase RutB [Antarctobacter heliothermus]|uniref:Peroxyureidoacrylate/ureidoacrylate amidohydrolase RutB n=1 Tax=Antarctobacter heliothermus TaxID=74033 RepID=A0A222E385_9RHOB|nr:isochorismatase family cysteine hydrolase [Antarctobacter heliothermus]ASP20448.1 peroxyureidoacrylate/ureidoacrylate amidohydrolase RutB [Antarctobacter heliothermus]